MKISKEIKTAVVVLGGILLFIMGFTYLKSSPIFDSSRKFIAVYDNIGGLTVGTTVNINGFQVGRVTEIKFHPKQSGRLVVTVSVDKDIAISKTSVIQLFENGLLGGKGIQIIPDHSNKQLAQSKDTLKGTNKPGMTVLLEKKLNPLVLKIEGAMSNADHLLTSINEVVDSDSKKSLKNTIEKLDLVMSDFAVSAKLLKGIMTTNGDKLSHALGNVDQITTNFAKLSEGLAASNLDKTALELQSAVTGLNNLLAKIESGQGTLGKLFEDEQMYTNLTKTSKQLELLLEDLRINPKRYMHFSVFGKKQKPYDSQKVTIEKNN